MSHEKSHKLRKLDGRTTVMLLLASIGVASQANPAKAQLCWTMGKYDATVYFAQSETSEDRKESFDALLMISGIDHREVECVSRSDQKFLTDLKRSWSVQKLEVVNTTFLSDLDY